MLYNVRGLWKAGGGLISSFLSVGSCCYPVFKEIEWKNAEETSWSILALPGSPSEFLLSQ